ncbi:DUF3794 and LysM peptidoglycan-binding domain-containing protein [Gottschalkia acidurici]|nr:SPOCS domain-containing protein [Gottschalkia acidurici]
MAVELIKDRLKIDQLVGKEEIQSLVEGEITLPENKPKIENVITLDGSVEITNKLVREDRLIVTGIVNFKTLYTTEEDEEQSIHSLESKTDFREEILLEEEYPGAIPVVTADIEHLEYTKITDYKVAVKTVIDIRSKLQLDNTIDIVRDIQGGEGIQILKETIKYNDTIGSNTTRSVVKETFELEEEMPNVLDVLRVNAKVYEKETRVVEGKVIVGGALECFIMYFSDDEEKKINYISQEIPFTHFVEIPGAYKDMDYTLSLQSGDINYDVRGDINGDLRIIDVETSVRIEAKVYTQSEKEVTTDTYSTVKKFDVKNEQIVITENIGKHSVDETLKGVVEVGHGDKVEDICNISAKPVLSDYRILEGKVIIEGLIEVDMLYLSDTNSSLNSVKQEIPFKSYIDIEDTKSDIDVDIVNILDNIDYNKTSDKEVELEITLKNQVYINRVKNINIVKEAIELDEELDKKSRPSITIYMVQKEDTIWDIAKRYNTTVDEIIRTNDIVNQENIMPGEKIIIEKHVDTVYQL